MKHQAKIEKRGYIAIPDSIIEYLQATEGSTIVFQKEDDGRVSINVQNESIRELAGILNIERRAKKEGTDFQLKTKSISSER